MRNPILGVIMWPFSKVLEGMFTFAGSYGLAIILFALLVKIILFYPSAKSKRNSMHMARLNPKMKEIKKRCGNDQQKYSAEVMQLYKDQGVSPMGGCLWSFIPLPILLALYGIIRKPLSNFMWLNESQINAVNDALSNLGVHIGGSAAYQEIETAKAVFDNFDTIHAIVPDVFRLDFNFLGIDLSAVPWNSFSDIMGGNLAWATVGLIAIPIVSGILNVCLTLLTNRVTPDSGDNGSTMKMMMIMMPLMSVYIGFILPASLGIYWIAQSVFSIIQELILQKYYGAKLEKEDMAREESAREERLRRIEAAKNRPQQIQNKNTSKKKLASTPATKKKVAKAGTTEAGRVGARPYARGRAYNESHYETGENTDNK